MERGSVIDNQEWLDTFDFEEYQSTKDNNSPGISYFYQKEISFSICAPMKDFNTKGMDIRDRKLIARPVPDPVVLFPVNGGYLIVTAWGKESKDNQITHSKNN